MQDFIIPRFDWEWDLLGRNAAVVFLGILAAIAGIAAIALMGPKIRIFDRLTLHTRITGTSSGPLNEGAAPPADLRGPSAASGPLKEGAAPPAELFPDAEEDYAALPGKTGRVTATLRPAGKAEIAGRILEVESEGLFVEADSPVRVVRVRGNRVVVRRV
jgi:membrane-bound serine protease (ClpP class)